MRRLDELLQAYGESHRNPVNKLIHWVCVPAIVWAVVALLWAAPFPGNGGLLNWAILALLLAQLYYLRLSVRLGLGLLLYNLAMLALAAWVDQNLATPLWLVALVVFVLAWVGQFIGHLIEGKRPSFFQDLQFLLIGPAWLLAFVYRAAGLKT